MTGALAGLRVIDLSDDIAGQYCGRLMADFGAEVVLVEPPGGTATRRIGPFQDGGSLAFLHLNRGKRLAGAADATGADVVIGGAATDPAPLRAANPRQIVAVISSFGADGPLAGWKGPEIILQALSGMMNSNGIAGREPLYGIGHRAAYAAGLAGYIAVLAALIGRETTGRGDTVRIDATETAVAMCFPYLQQFLYNGTDRRRGVQDIPAGQVTCRGAWVCLWVYSNRYERLCRALGLEACLTDPRFAEVKARSRHWPEFFALVQARVADRDPDAFVAELQGLDIISARAYRPSELRAADHLQARGYWREIMVDGRAVTCPGPAFRLSATPARIPGPPEG
jgi:crotonobetainyl-CoA:carnitine CoA-transferase CaiB-like acyl-CoA transferase